ENPNIVESGRESGECTERGLVGMEGSVVGTIDLGNVSVYGFGNFF
ncbi:MAG: hypothetical protein UX84_C0002G0075, partial [Microgenomates group bacterium GW2011_GWD1_47_13]